MDHAPGSADAQLREREQTFNGFRMGQDIPVANAAAMWANVAASLLGRLLRSD